jgi:phosphoesterase RecJ-like protein
MGKAEIIGEIRDANRILLVGHVNPDGDSIASQLALAKGLEQLGRTVSIQSHDPVPYMYRRLPGAEAISKVEVIKGEFDLALMIECPKMHRSGFESVPAGRIAGIDHHPDYDLEADTHWLDTTAAAVAEMMYELLLDLGCTITKDIAENLMMGLMTDSGSFTYPNTTARSLDIAAALVRKGANTTNIANMAYRSYPLDRLDLMSELLGSMRRFCDGQLVIMTMDEKTIRKRGYTGELFEDMVNYPLAAELVLISALGRQDAGGQWRFSLRSKGEVDVGAIAREFGGGGHKNAAGFRSRDKLDEIIDSLVETVGYLPDLSARS